MIRRDRIGGAVAALVLQAGLFAALYLGLLVQPGLRSEPPLIMLVPVAEVPQAVPDPPVQRRAPRRSGQSAPPAPKARATSIVVPPPVVVPLVIPPIVAAELPDAAADAATGEVLAGSGSAAGGEGSGNGQGDAGAGDGGGGTPAQWLRGRIRNSDYPRAAIMARMQGTLVARYRIGTDGRVADCTVLKSSGSAVLDETTCRLVRERFRYRPARDERGDKVVAYQEEEHAWVIAPPQ